MAKRIHGESRRSKDRPATKEYKAWEAMIQRCYNFAMKGRAFRDYGGRGIRVCDRWLEPDGQGYLNFLADLGRAPTRHHSLDRENTNGHYEPGNARWLDDRGQAANRRSTKWIEYQGHRKYLTEWAEFFGMSKAAVSSMVQRRGEQEAIAFYLEKKGICLPPLT